MLFGWAGEKFGSSLYEYISIVFVAVLNLPDDASRIKSSTFLSFIVIVMYFIIGLFNIMFMLAP